MLQKKTDPNLHISLGNSAARPPLKNGLTAELFSLILWTTCKGVCFSVIFAAFRCLVTFVWSKFFGYCYHFTHM